CVEVVGGGGVRGVRAEQGGVSLLTPPPDSGAGKRAAGGIVELAGWPNRGAVWQNRRRMARNGAPQKGTAAQALRRMAEADPELAARLIVHALPAAAATLPEGLSYRLELDGLGAWTVRPNGERADAIVRIRYSDWLRLLAGEVTPPDAMRLGLTEVEGSIPPVTQMGRWIDRAEGVDGPEQEREQRQRIQQARNAGSWGSRASSNGSAGDPAESRPKGGLMNYEQLYALWERQNWRAHELDFSVDREHWLVTPSEAQRHT